MERDLRVAVIGAAGNAGKRHCAAFQAEGCEVVPVEIGQHAPDYCPEAPIVSIATPDDLHVGHACDALRAGKSVFCEKPLAHDAFSLARLEKTAKAANVTFSANLPLRYSRKLRDLNLSGLTYMGGMYGWGRKSKMSGWRGQIPDYSIVCGGGIHLVDLMLQRYNVAPTDILAIRRGALVCSTFHLGPAICSLTVDFSYEGRHEVNMTFGSGRGYLPVTFDEPNDFREPIRDFLRAAQAGEPGNGLEALQANRVCLAIEEAAK
jgi:predicted dehydrogenase